MRPGKRVFRKGGYRFAIRIRANWRAQRFDFLAFFFFLGAFLAAFLTAFLADFFAEDFLEAFLAFLVFLAFFGITLFATFLAAFLTFLTTVLAASLVASAALLSASVVCSRIGFSSSITSPRGYRSADDSGIRRPVKEMPSVHLPRTLPKAASARSRPDLWSMIGAG